MKQNKNRCGNCLFAKPEVFTDGQKTGRFHCIVGGTNNGTFGPYRDACITYKPNMREARRRDSSIARRAALNVEHSLRAASRRIKHATVEWTPEMDATLTDMFHHGHARSVIADRIAVEASDVAIRISQLKLRRNVNEEMSPAERRIEAIMEAQPLLRAKPIDPITRRFPGVKPCSGRCCKYKDQCQHYISYIENGRPIAGCISTINDCIVGTERYISFIGIDGEKSPDFITFAEGC